MACNLVQAPEKKALVIYKEVTADGCKFPALRKLLRRVAVGPSQFPPKTAVGGKCVAMPSQGMHVHARAGKES